MNKEQKYAVEHLWFIFGNAGPKYTKGNHEFLRCKLEDKPGAEHYQPSEECVKAYEQVMAGNYSCLHPKVQEALQQMVAEREHWEKVAGVESLEKEAAEKEPEPDDKQI